MPHSKFEDNPMLRLRVKHTSFSLLASLCSNDYFYVYAIISFLANRLVFFNMVAYITRKMVPIKKRAGVIPYIFSSSLLLLSSLLSCSFYL